MRFATALVLVSLVSTPAVVQGQPAPVRIARVALRDGPGDATLVRRALTASSAELRVCQERRIARGVRVVGRMDIALVVGPGEASRVEVVTRPEESDRALEACLLRVVRALDVVVPATTTFHVMLALSASAAREVAGDDPAVIRAEIVAARAEARCIARAASGLERLLAAWERAGPRGRERLAARIAAARAARSLCGPGLLGTLGTGLGQGLGVGLGDPCPGCPGTMRSTSSAWPTGGE